MIWQDVLLSIGLIAFGLVLIPQLLDCIRRNVILNLFTATLTTTWLYIFTFTFSTLQLWLSMASEFFTATIWLLILIYSLRNTMRSRGEKLPETALARRIHMVYQEEAKHQGDTRYPDNYDDLPENIKEYDRALARWILVNFKELEEFCPACGHFLHPNGPCGWHGGSCDEALTDSSLWCTCDGKHPRGRPIEPRKKCWRRLVEDENGRVKQ